MFLTSPWPWAGKQLQAFTQQYAWGPNELTHCCLETLFEIWVSFCSGSGLLPNRIKPLPEPTVDLSSKVFCGIHLRAISQEILKISIHKMSLTITLLELQPHFLGANELRILPCLGECPPLSLICLYPPICSSLAVWGVNKKKPLVTYASAHTGPEEEPQLGENWITAVASLQHTDLVASGTWHTTQLRLRQTLI